MKRQGLGEHCLPGTPSPVPLAPIEMRYGIDIPHAVKPLNSGQLRVLRILSVIERCPLLGGNLKRIVTFGN